MNELLKSSRRMMRSRRGLLLAAGGLGVPFLLFQWGEWIQPSGSGATATLDPMQAELLQAADKANICTAANAIGVGLRGEYFAQSDLSGSRVLARVDDVVDFDASIRQQEGGLNVSSVRWAGWIKSPISGHYRFHADAPHMRVLVAQQLVAGNGTPPDAKVDMAAGRFYPIEVVVTQITDSPARIRLEWTAPHGSRYVVPRTLLHLPTDKVTNTRP